MSNDPLKTLRLQKRLDAAAVALVEGRLEEAQAIYGQILAEEPGHAPALHGLGVLHVRAGRPDAGEQCLRQAVEAEPESPRLLNDLGEALRLQGKKAEARAVYDEALRLDPEDAQLHNNLGALLLEDDPESARQHFLDAIRLAPEDPHAYNNLGVLLEHQGRHADALACYEAAVTVDPAYQVALENHRALLGKHPELLEASLNRLLAQAEALLAAGEAKNG
ncbi:MAG: tetratricopeptide repeat protein [Rhodocyclaceae bacterium]|jgi:Flp pilus assembly protein TadD|nr:tetratricopeptide repeat protein [Rhodocyclaceae bacterium]